MSPLYRATPLMVICVLGLSFAQDRIELPPHPQPWVVQAYYPDDFSRKEVAARFGPWLVNRDEGYLLIEVDEAKYRELEAMGFGLLWDEAHTKMLHHRPQEAVGQDMGIPGFPCYRTVEETFASAQGMTVDYPNLATLVDIGDTWRKTENASEGYDILALVLTNSAISGDKPKLITTSAIHAREYATAELATRFAEHLLSHYGTNADITWLLDYHEIHLILQTNPDGRKEAEAGDLWRKNHNNDYCAGTNDRGADLNRNFSFLWGCCNGSSLSQCDDTYRGAAAASEPEVQAVINYLVSEFPDQRPDDVTVPAPEDATGFYIDIHSYSRLVLYPWGYTDDASPNDADLTTVGRKLAFFNDYSPESSSDLYITDGTTGDFAYGELGVAAYIFELGTSFFQNCSSFEDTIVPDNIPALIEAAKLSRTPYLNAGGPEVVGPGVDRVAEPGETVTLTANVDDSRYNNSNGTEPVQNIASVAYYVNTPPWEAGAVAVAMNAVDGNFDSPAELVTANLDTTGLSEGRHTIFVVAIDSDGNVGVPTAAFLYVLNPATAARIEGYVRNAETMAPVGATITTATFTTTSDPVSGFYSMILPEGIWTVDAEASDYAGQSIAGLQTQTTGTVQQDFLLAPICTVLDEDGETGASGWTMQSPWALSGEDIYGGSFAFNDSPLGEYANNADIWVMSPIMNLSEFADVSLTFYTKYNLETNYDYGYVEYSTDGGLTWTQAANVNGVSGWEAVNLNLPALSGESQARIRFRLDTDFTVTRDGWLIDDILLFGGSTNCNASLNLMDMLPDWAHSYTILDLVQSVNAVP